MAIVTEQIYRGHSIAYVNLFPLRVRPAAEQAFFTASMTVEVTSAPDAARAEASARTYRDDPATRAWLARQVANPQAGEDYAAWWRRAQALRPGLRRP